MTEEAVYLLANALNVAYADGALAPAEETAIEELRVNLGAKKRDVKAARGIVESGYQTFTGFPRLSDRLLNLEEMLNVCLSDGDVDERERAILSDTAQRSGISAETLGVLVKEAKIRGSGTVGVGSSHSPSSEFSILHSSLGGRALLQRGEKRNEEWRMKNGEWRNTGGFPSPLTPLPERRASAKGRVAGGERGNALPVTRCRLNQRGRIRWRCSRRIA
jgi:uncharacterized tellurite resistance protein B-like protein